MTRLAAIIGVLLIAVIAQPQNPPVERALLNQYCVGCHNEKTKTAGLALDKLDLEHPGSDPEAWEKVVRKLRAGMMPPSGMPRPDRTTLDAWTAKLKGEGVVFLRQSYRVGTARAAMIEGPSHEAIELVEEK